MKTRFLKVKSPAGPIPRRARSQKENRKMVSINRDQAADRDRLAAFLALMQGASTTLRQDECGDYRINGQRGHIYRDGDGFLLCIRAGRGPVAWRNVKAALARFLVSQDGDDEGCIKIADASAKEAETIRKIARIRKRPPRPANAFDRS
jgi:hypothetical protein